MAEPKNKNFLEKLNDGRFIIRENLVVNSKNLIKLPITESNHIVEVDGEKYSCRAAYSGVEISKPNVENLNERIYTDKLWEKVIKEQKEIWNGCLGLANHPKNEADVLNTFCIWRNLRFNEKKDLILADMYLVGENGQLAKEILDAHGKIGLSSSAYGDFKDDGKTIDESSFEIERIADWVDTPSFGVYAYKNNEITTENKEKDKNSSLLEQQTTNRIEHLEKEKNMSDVNKKLAPLEEKNFKLNIRKLIKEAKDKKSFSERLGEYKEILSYFEGVDFASDLKVEVENSIKNLNEEIIVLAEKGKEMETLKENSSLTEKEKDKLTEALKSITEKYEIAQAILEEIRDYSKNLEEMNKIAIAEKNGMVDPADYLILYKKYEALNEQDDKKDDEEGEAKKDNNDKTDKDGKETKKDNKDGEKKESRMKEEDDKDDEKEDGEEKKESPMKEEDNDEEEDDDEEDDEEEIEEIFDFKNTKQIKSYYEDLVEQYPQIKEFKKDFLSCKTLIEAQKLWLDVEDAIYRLPPKRIEIDNEDKTSRKRESKYGINKLLNEGWK